MPDIDHVKQLDPIYNLSEYDKRKEQKPLDRSAARHNAWRAKLPEHCWLCANFNRCSPGHKCRHQVDIDVQAQLGVKHERY